MTGMKHRSEEERKFIVEAYTRIVDRCHRNNVPVPSLSRLANQMGMPCHTLTTYLKEFDVKPKTDKASFGSSCLGINV